MPVFLKNGRLEFLGYNGLDSPVVRRRSDEDTDSKQKSCTVKNKSISLKSFPDLGRARTLLVLVGGQVTPVRFRTQHSFFLEEFFFPLLSRGNGPPNTALDGGPDFQPLSQQQ